MAFEITFRRWEKPFFGELANSDSQTGFVKPEAFVWFLAGIDGLEYVVIDVIRSDDAAGFPDLEELGVINVEVVDLV
jgi:hypothetical protein